MAYGTHSETRLIFKLRLLRQKGFTGKLHLFRRPWGIVCRGALMWNMSRSSCPHQFAQSSPQFAAVRCGAGVASKPRCHCQRNSSLGHTVTVSLVLCPELFTVITRFVLMLVGANEGRLEMSCLCSCNLQGA